MNSTKSLNIKIEQLSDYLQDNQLQVKVVAEADLDGPTPMEYINSRIYDEVDDDAIMAISDTALAPKYMSHAFEAKGQQEKVDAFCANLKRQHFIGYQLTAIREAYSISSLSAISKSKIKHDAFSEVVQRTIHQMGLDDAEYEISFDVKAGKRRSDWSIHHIKTGRTLVGTNLIDVWSTDALHKKGSAIVAKKDTPKVKHVVVICNRTQVKADKSKLTKLLKIAFKNDSICFNKTLSRVIKKFFAQDNE